MAAILIANTMPFNFGQMTNQQVARIIAANTAMQRLNEAVATASSAFTGTAGTQFEVGNTDPANVVPNLFGVQADPANPGKSGNDYSYAIGQLSTVWQTFWTAAQPYLEQLDNGQAAF